MSYINAIHNGAYSAHIDTRGSRIMTFDDLHTLETRIGVFACGQILCISPNGLQASHGMN